MDRSGGNNMRIVSAQSAHWTDEQLIDHLYGIGPADGHLSQCEFCHGRLTAMEARRKQALAEETVSHEFLAAQRRAIYARLEKPHRWWDSLPMRRLAAGVAMLVVLAGSAAVYEKHRRDMAAEAISDAQLVQDVAQMSFESESPATAPLRELFIQ
jgi:hypothetical protein